MTEQNRFSTKGGKANIAPVIVERTFDAPVGKVWQAITDKGQMKQWYFDLAEFKPEVGFEFRFYGGTKEKQYLHLCKIVDVVPPKKITYSWRYDGYEGISFVTFDLFDGGNKTTVRLTHEGLESFPASNPDLAREKFLEGWTSIVGSSLKGFLESNLQESATVQERNRKNQIRTTKHETP